MQSAAPFPLLRSPAGPLATRLEFEPAAAVCGRACRCLARAPAALAPPGGVREPQPGLPQSRFSGGHHPKKAAWQLDCAHSPRVFLLSSRSRPDQKNLTPQIMTEKVALIGSGNWGSAIATKLGVNALSNPMFDKTVEMWVFEEYVKLEKTAKGDQWIRPARGSKPPEGKTWVDVGFRPLTEVINERHENVIYLPGIPLPKSIVAEPDIHKAVTDATMMIFVIPHNFLAPIVPKMNGAFAKEAIGIVSDPREAAAHARGACPERPALPTTALPC